MCSHANSPSDVVTQIPNTTRSDHSVALVERPPLELGDLTPTLRSEASVGGHQDVPAGGHEEDLVAITDASQTPRGLRREPAADRGLGAAGGYVGSCGRLHADYPVLCDGAVGSIRVAGEIVNRGWHVVRMALDCHEELVLARPGI